MFAVLGGGPAGLAAALALRQRGCSVALYDGQHPPIDKACGEGPMPESVRLLAGLGSALDERRRRASGRRRVRRCSMGARPPRSSRGQDWPYAAHSCIAAWPYARPRWGSSCTGVQRGRWHGRWVSGGGLGGPCGLFCDRRRAVLDACGAAVSASALATARVTPAASNFSARHGATAWRCNGARMNSST